jgi:hypothetical protein
MGWRSMVVEHADPITFAADDRRLEAALDGVVLEPPGCSLLSEERFGREFQVEWRAPTKVR